MSRQRRKSSFFDIFKACCSGGGGDEVMEEPVYARRIYASDEDRGYWVGEPGIDRRASAFISRFYETRRADPEAVVY